MTAPFHELFAHATWRTKAGQPLIIPEVETLLVEFLEARCKAMPGVRCHAVGVTADHVHVVFEYEPRVAPGAVVEDLMASSAREVQLDNGLRAVEWQRGFGIVSFGRRNLAWVLGYVARQREIHAAGTVQPRLEDTGGDAKPVEVTKEESS